MADGGGEALVCGGIYRVKNSGADSGGHGTGLHTRDAGGGFWVTKRPISTVPCPVPVLYLQFDRSQCTGRASLVASGCWIEPRPRPGRRSVQTLPAWFRSGAGAIRPEGEVGPRWRDVSRAGRAVSVGPRVSRQQRSAISYGSNGTGGYDGYGESHGGEHDGESDNGESHDGEHTCCGTF